MKFTFLYFIFLTVIVTLFSEDSFCHGGGKKESKEIEIKPVTRVAPKEISVLESSKTERYLSEKELPEDVLIVSCTLSGTPCKGLTIELLDSHGDILLRSNTGLVGAIGAQGLNEDQELTAKISSEKYHGHAVVFAGKYNFVIGEKK